MRFQNLKPSILFLFILHVAMSQAQRAYYGSTEICINFSLADIDAGTANVDNILRFAPVLNIAAHLNLDLSSAFGFTLGMGIENSGFVAGLPDEEKNVRMKYRTYNLGFPVGFKFGDLNQEDPMFFFGGYEAAFPINYKEKKLVNGDREDITTSWFTDRTPTLVHSLFAGIQFRNGISLKAKYGLSNFFNQDYTEYEDDPVTSERIPVKPFENIEVHVITVSISIYPFQDVFHMYQKALDEEKRIKTITVLY